MNFDRLRFVADRADFGEEKEALITVIIPEKPGRFFATHYSYWQMKLTSFTLVSWISMNASNLAQ
jgi:threonine dehydratase